MEELEIWVDATGCEGLYEISNMGRFKRKSRVVYKGMGKYKYIIPEIILIPVKNKGGYVRYGFNISGKQHRFLGHRLVWFSFRGGDIKKFDQFKKTLVCHKNDIKHDNRLCNLFLGDGKDNIRDCINKGLFPIRPFGNDNPMSKKVGQYTNEGILLKEWLCIMEVERAGIAIATDITKVCRGKRKSAGGYIREYL